MWRLKDLLRWGRQEPQHVERAASKVEPSRVLKGVGFKVYTCKICGYETRTRRAIREHIRQHHKREWRIAINSVKKADDAATRSEYASAPRKNRPHLKDFYEVRPA